MDRKAEADYFMAPLLWHLEPLVCDPGAPMCGECSSDMELVGPELLWYDCVRCSPRSFEWTYLRRN